MPHAPNSGPLRLKRGSGLRRESARPRPGSATWERSNWASLQAVVWPTRSRRPNLASSEHRRERVRRRNSPGLSPSRAISASRCAPPSRPTDSASSARIPSATVAVGRRWLTQNFQRDSASRFDTQSDPGGSSIDSIFRYPEAMTAATARRRGTANSSCRADDRPERRVARLRADGPWTDRARR